MLLLDSSFELSGVTLYRDHANPSLFHHLPGPPRLVASEGFPGIALIMYRGVRSGGLLSLDVDLALPKEQRDAITSVLAKNAGADIELVPALFDKGTARIVVLGTESAPATVGADDEQPEQSRRLVERVIATATPSLLGAGRAIFAAHLDPEGAILMRDAIATDSVPAVIAYELSFRGLRPSRGLRISVDVAMAYDYLRARLAPSTLWFRADVDQEAEALQRLGHIEIDDVDYTGTDPEMLAARREEAVRTIREVSETLFYRPAASPASVQPAKLTPSGVGEAWKAAGLVAAAFVLRDLAQDERQSLTYALDETSVGETHIAPQGALLVPDGVGLSDIVRQVDLTELPAAMTVVAVVPPLADWTGVRAIQVDIRSGQEVRTVVLSSTQPEGTVVMPRRDLEQRVRPLLEADPNGLGEPPAGVGEFLPLDGAVLMLDPQRLANRRNVKVLLAAVDGVVTEAECELHAGNQVRSVVLSPARPEANLAVWGTPTIELRADLATAAGSIHIEQILASHQTTVVLDPPRDRFRTVGIELQDPLGRFESVTVEVEKASGDGHRVFNLGAATPSARWTYARGPGTATRWRYRTSTFGRDGSVSEQVWVDTDQLLLVVGDTDIRVGPITVVFVGWPEIQGALLAIEPAEPPPGVPARTEVVVLPGTTRVAIQLKSPRVGSRQYVLTGDVFGPDGVTHIRRTSDAEVLLLEPDPSSG